MGSFTAMATVPENQNWPIERILYGCCISRRDGVPQGAIAAKQTEILADKGFTAITKLPSLALCWHTTIVLQSQEWHSPTGRTHSGDGLISISQAVTNNENEPSKFSRWTANSPHSYVIGSSRKTLVDGAPNHE